MAIEYVDLVLRGVHGVDPTAKLVLIVIADYARRNSGGRAWPSVTTLAAEVGIKDRNVQRQLSALVRTGWLIAENVSRGGRASVYRINVDRMIRGRNGDARVTVNGDARITVNGDASDTVRGGTTMTPVTSDGDAHVTETVTPASPEPGVYQPEGSLTPIEKGKVQPPKTEAQLRIERLASRAIRITGHRGRG